MLPNGYKELESIESTGTQYIDTGFKPNGNTRILMEAEIISHSVNGSYFGTRSETSSSNIASNTLLILDDEGLRSDFYGNSVSKTSYPNGKQTIDRNKNITTIGSISIVNTESTKSSTYNLFLFATNTAGSMSIAGNIKVYFCKIYDNETLIRDYVPCKNINGIIGLYDDVNKKFYQNAGTGNFIAGQEVDRTPETPSFFKSKLAVPLEWSPVECEGYKIFKNDFLLVDTAETSYVDYDVSNDDNITYKLIAYNGNYETDPLIVNVFVKEGWTLLTPVIEEAFF